MSEYVSFKLVSIKDRRIYLNGSADITTIGNDEVEFEFEQNDGTFDSHIPHYWKTFGEDLTDEFDRFIGNIDWGILIQYLYDFAEDDVTVNFYGDILIINNGADKSTTIRVDQTTKIRLEILGDKSCSFDDIINMLIEEHYSKN